MNPRKERLTGIIVKGISALYSALFSKLFSLTVSRCGSGLKVLEGVKITGGRGIRIGNNCFIGRHVVLDAAQGDIQIGDNVEIRDFARLYARDIRIGNGTTIGEFSFILGRVHLAPSAWIARKCDLRGRVQIGKAILGPGVQCIAGPDHRSHPETGSFEMSGEEDPEGRFSIRIADGAWVGQNALILKGVTLDANTLVAAGSVVTRPVPDNHMARGVAARNFERKP